MPTDAELLHRYAGQKDERAFAELVERHLGLVYATALRSTGGRRHLAEEIVQKVFTDVARKAAQLCHHPVLTGWLYRSTRYVAMETNRTELRRQIHHETFAVIPDTVAPLEPSMDWEGLRPVIDDALEELKERDREIMLLRFFQGLTFGEVGARLNLSENAARMRTERALEKLRGHLGRRGITSTAALAGLLSSHSLVAAPVGLAASVTTAAVATAPAGALTALFSGLILHKTATAILGAALAAGVTAVTWVVLADDVSEGELAALRRENAHLRQAAAGVKTATPTAAFTAGPAAQTEKMVMAIRKSLGERGRISPGGHRNHGQATPKDAVRSMAWAYDSGDVGALVRILCYDQQGLETIRAIHASMPETIRLHYRTPEEFIAFLYGAQALIKPMPEVDVWDRKITDAVMTEPSRGRALLRDPGQRRGGLEFVHTPEGWKLELPAAILPQFVSRVLGNEMLAKLGVH